MKKFFSLVLALVMALSLTTVAWGADAVIEVGAGKTHTNLTEAREHAMTLTTATSVTYKIYGAVEVLTHTETPPSGMHHGDFAFGPAGVPVVIEGADTAAKVTVIGGGVPDIVNTTFKNLTFADKGTYLPTANEFMYQNFENCNFEKVVFEDAPRLSGTCTVTGCTFNNTTDQKYALWMDAGDFTIEDSAFVLEDDGYGAVKSDASGSPLKLENNTFTNNSGSQKEALNTNGMVITATGNTFTDFTAGLLPADKTNTLNSETVTGAAADAAVKKSNATKLTGAVAKVGNNEYATVADAIAAAGANDVIVLLDTSATIPATHQALKLTDGSSIVVPAVTRGDKFDLYLANADMNTALKLKTPTVAGLSFTEVAAKTNKDGSGRVAYIAANNGQFFVKTTAPTTTSYAVTYAGKTDVLYYVNLGPAGAGYYEYSDTCDVVTEFGVKCGQCAFTNTAYTANPLKTYFVLADEETVCESKAAVADPQYNFLVNGVVYSGTIVGKVVDHSFTANDFDYNATLKQNVPTSAICTKCLMVSTSIYLDGKVPAGKAFYDIANATAYSVVAEAAAGTVVTPSTDKVTSAETFDAGIAMYVGMSVMAAAGSAVVLKKKD